MAETRLSSIKRAEGPGLKEGSVTELDNQIIPGFPIHSIELDMQWFSGYAHLDRLSLLS